jgi:hypothetical protein
MRGIEVLVLRNA